MNITAEIVGSVGRSGDLARKVGDKLARWAGAQSAFLCRFEDSADGMVARVASIHPAQPSAFDSSALQGLLSDAVLLEAAALWTGQDAPADARATMSRLGLDSCLVVPCRTAGRIAGALLLCDVSTDGWEASILESAEPLSVIVALMLEDDPSDERLQPDEQRFRSLVEASSDWIWEVDQNGVYTYASPKVTDLLGYSPEEVVGRTAFELMPDDEARRLKPVFEAAAAAGKPLVGLENTNLHKDGHRVVLETSGVVIRDKEGQVAGYRGVDRDVTARKDFEDTLQLTQFTLDHTADAAFWMGPDARFTYVNKAACESLGYSREELLTMSVADVDPGFPKDAWPQHWEDVARHGSLTFETRHRTKDGTTFPVEVRTNFVRFGDREYNCAFARDISQRKKTELALRQNEEKLSSLYQNMSEGVALHEVIRDATGEVTDYRVLDVNPAYESILGVWREDVVGLLASKIHETGEPPYLCHYAAVAESGDPISFEGYFPAMNKHFAISAFRPGPNQFATVFSDITDRVESEEELLQSRQRLALHVERTPLGVIEWDRDFKVAQWNSAAERIFGYSRKEALGHHPAELILNESVREHIDQIWVGLSAQTGGLRSTNENITKSGQTILCEWYNTPLVDRDGTLLGVASLVQDITQRMQAEAEREELIGQLEAQNAELERFTYTVSHDLKSPLITIKGYLGLLREDLDADEQDAVRDDVSRMEHAADRMERLLEDLLEISRIGRMANPSEDIPLTELAGEAAELVSGQIRERGVDVHIREELPVMYGDRPRLLEVLQNLIDNAVKYMGNQSRPRIEIGSRVDDGQTVCYVRDNGIGIDSQYQDRVFGLFDQLDQAAKGSGIGLALVKRIVELHQGRVWVESEGVGHGATFCFTCQGQPSPP